MEENTVNIMGTPLRSNSFFASYHLQGKELKYHLLIRFIYGVVAAGFPREAEQMLVGATISRLSHILRYVQKRTHSVGWMTKMDYGAHLSAWLHCLTTSEDLEHALGPEGRHHLSDLLNLPASYGGVGLQSLEASSEEELQGSFA